MMTLERWSVETEEPEGAVPETWNVKQYVPTLQRFDGNLW